MAIWQMVYGKVGLQDFDANKAEEYLERLNILKIDETKLLKSVEGGRGLVLYYEKHTTGPTKLCTQRNDGTLSSLLKFPLLLRIR